MLIEAKATLKLTGYLLSVLFCFLFFFFPNLSTSRPLYPWGNGCFLIGGGKWAGGGIEVISYWLTSCRYYRAGSLGSCCLPWFPASALFSLVIHFWDILLCHACLSGPKLCMEKIQWSAGLQRDFWVWKARGSWLLASCFVQKRKKQEQPSHSRTSTFDIGNLPPGLLLIYSLQPQNSNLYPQSPWQVGAKRNRDMLPLLAPSLWSWTENRFPLYLFRSFNISVRNEVLICLPVQELAS